MALAEEAKILEESLGFEKMKARALRNSLKLSSRNSQHMLELIWD